MEFLLDYNIQILIMDSLEIWKTHGAKAGIEHILNFKKDYLNVNEAMQIIEIILKELGVNSFDSIEMRNKVSKVIIHRNNINDLSRSANLNENFRKICDLWKQKLDEVLDELVLEIENFIKNQKNKEDELNAAFVRKQENIINEAMNVYKEEGLRNTIKYLCKSCDKNNVYTIFNNVIYKIYDMNNVKYEENPYWEPLINAIMNSYTYVKDIENSEMSRENFNFYNRGFNSNISKLVHEILRDFSISRLDINNQVSDFIPVLFEQHYQDRTVNGIYQHIYEYFEHRDIVLEDDNNFRELIKEILDLNESVYISSPLKVFDDKDDKDMNVVTGKISELINSVTNYLNSKGYEPLSLVDRKASKIKKYYAQMEEIVNENKELYAQIDDLQRRIEENAERKRILTEEFKEGTMKK